MIQSSSYYRCSMQLQTIFYMYRIFPHCPQVTLVSSTACLHLHVVRCCPVQFYTWIMKRLCLSLSGCGRSIVDQGLWLRRDLEYFCMKNVQYSHHQQQNLHQVALVKKYLHYFSSFCFVLWNVSRFCHSEMMAKFARMRNGNGIADRKISFAPPKSKTLLTTGCLRHLFSNLVKLTLSAGLHNFSPFVICCPE